MIKLSQSLVSLQHNAPVHVEYRCVQSSMVVGIDVRVTTDSRSARDAIVFAQRWLCSTPGVVHRRTVRLRLPDYLAYRPDYNNRSVVELGFDTNRDDQRHNVVRFIQ